MDDIHLLGLEVDILLVKPNDYVDPYGTLNNRHKILFRLSLLGSSETLWFWHDCVAKLFSYLLNSMMMLYLGINQLVSNI